MWEIFITIFIVLSTAGTIFWIYMLIDCSTKEPDEDKMMWIIIILAANWIGALIYYYYQRPKRLDIVKRDS